MCGTASGGAASSRRWRRCRPRRRAGAPRSPGSGRAGHWTERRRPRCSPRRRQTRCGLCRPARSRWRRGLRRRSAPDIHAQVDRVLYSVPWQHIGKTADVRLTPTMVQFFIGGQLVKTHPRKQRGKQTDYADYPPEKIAFHMRTPAWCRRQAADIGPACEQVIAGLLTDNALYRLRAAQGIIGLADRHDRSRLEAACVKAIAAGDPSYRTVKGILAAGTESDTPTA